MFNEYKPIPMGIGNMTVQPSILPGVRWINSPVMNDERGYFFEGYRESIYRALSGDFTVQTNISISVPFVLRGFHWHREQYDFWSIASGMAQVVVQGQRMVEWRVLSAGQGVIIPPKTGHGFLALANLVLIYNVTTEYDHTHPDEQGYTARAFEEWLTPVDKTIRSERDIAYDTTGGTPPW